MMTGPRLFKLKSADETETSIRLGPELDLALIHKGLGVAAEFTPEEALMFALRLADMAFERKVDVARAEAMHAELAGPPWHPEGMRCGSAGGENFPAFSKACIFGIRLVAGGVDGTRPARIDRRGRSAGCP